MDHQVSKVWGNNSRNNGSLGRQRWSGVLSLIESPFHIFLLHFLNHKGRQHSTVGPFSLPQVASRITEVKHQESKDSWIKRDGFWPFPVSPTLGADFFPGDVMDLKECIQKFSSFWTCSTPHKFHPHPALIYWKSQTPWGWPSSIKTHSMTTSSREVSPTLPASEPHNTSLWKSSAMNEKHSVIKFEMRCRLCPLSEGPGSH